MTHELKVLSEYYWKIPCEKKTFELRKDDRDYKVGDILDLKEWDGEKFTGHYVRREITYILRNCKQYGLEDGYCIIGMQPKGWNYIGLAKAESRECGREKVLDKIRKALDIIDKYKAESEDK